MRLIQALALVSHLNFQTGITEWINRYWPQLVHDIGGKSACENIVTKIVHRCRTDMHTWDEACLKGSAGGGRSGVVKPDTVVLFQGTAYPNSIRLRTSNWAHQLTSLYIEAASIAGKVSRLQKRRSIDLILANRVEKLREPTHPQVIPDRMQAEIESFFAVNRRPTVYQRLVSKLTAGQIFKPL